MSREVFEVVFTAWLAAFALSLAVEVPVFVLVARKQVPAWRAAVAGAAGTCLTHPLLWFVWVRVIEDYSLFIVLGELLVCCIETLTFWALARPVPLRRALAASFLANGASYGVGLVLERLS
jgi:hypothetical protein